MYLFLGAETDKGFPVGGGANLSGPQYTNEPHFRKNCMKLINF